jgi:predicted Zn-dependent peptidase
MNWRVGPADQVRGTTLPCGMEVWVFPRRGFVRKHAVLTVRFGAIDRSFNDPLAGGIETAPAGIAHFLEHQMFVKGEEDLGETFAALGAEVNAYTSHTETAYYFSCVERYDACLDLLLRLVERPDLTPEGVENERRIIMHELRQYRDDPEGVAFLGLMQSLYGACPLADDIAGTEAGLAAVSHRQLQRCADVFYRPKNMSLILVGDLEPDREFERMEVKSKEFVGSGLKVAGFKVADDKKMTWSSGRAPAPRLPRPIAVPRSQPLPVVLQAPVEHPRLNLGYAPALQAEGADSLLRRELALDMGLDMCLGPASQFYHRNYSKGVIDWDTFAYEVYADPAFFFCLIGGETTRPDDFARAVGASLAESCDIRQIRKAFEQMRQKAFGHWVQRYDQVDLCAAWLQRILSLGAKPDDMIRAYEEVGPEDIFDSLAALATTGEQAMALVEKAR